MESDMAKLIYEKPELISLVEQDSAMGKCINGSVNVSMQCQSGSIALSSTCNVGTSAGGMCQSGISAKKKCGTGSTVK